MPNIDCRIFLRSRAGVADAFVALSWRSSADLIDKAKGKS